MTIRHRASLLECGIVAVLFLTNEEVDLFDAEDEQLLYAFALNRRCSINSAQLSECLGAVSSSILIASA